jgi:hypothetical protein
MWRFLLLLILLAGCSDRHTIKGYLTEIRHDTNNWHYITLKFEGGMAVDVYNHNSVPLYIGHYQELEVETSDCGHYAHEPLIISNHSPTYDKFLAAKRQQDLTADYEKQVATK